MKSTKTLIEKSRKETPNNINQGAVSKRLKLHGLENLWVVDASIFPNITSGNINATVMMLANLGSKLIIEDIKKMQ